MWANDILCMSQMRNLIAGIGAIPDAALAALRGHKDLAIHTEMFSDGVLDLVECNAITNSKKDLHPGKVRSVYVFEKSRCWGPLFIS